MPEEPSLPAWKPEGAIVIDRTDRPLFPKIDKGPGLYRIRLADGKIYIGQSKCVRTRLDDYRNPKDGVEGEAVLHDLLVQARGGTLCTALGSEMADAKHRRQLEKALQIAAVAQGGKVLNGAGSARADMLEAKIAYHERRLRALRSALSALRPRPA